MVMKLNFMLFHLRAVPVLPWLSLIGSWSRFIATIIRYDLGTQQSRREKGNHNWNGGTNVFLRNNLQSYCHTRPQTTTKLFSFMVSECFWKKVPKTIELVVKVAFDKRQRDINTRLQILFLQHHGYYPQLQRWASWCGVLKRYTLVYHCIDLTCNYLYTT